MNKEFFAALDALEQEKGIPKTYMLEKIEAALTAAFRKEYGPTSLFRVAVDPEKEDMRVYLQKTVVEEVSDPLCEISLEDALAISKRYEVGKVIETEVKTKNFRRLSAAAAKSVIIQAIREGERKAAQETYEQKREGIITATVSKIDPETGDAVLEIGNGFAVLRRSEQLENENFMVGDQIKVFVSEVNREEKGPILKLSRIHPGLVRKLFELEIPEVADRTVRVKGVAREAGSRTKIAVFSMDESVDAVGACIGSHGVRIGNIVSEFGGEKIDVIRYSEKPEEFVSEALSPATVQSVTMLTDRSCRVIVAPDQLTLAIGKKGQNVRLAARLTGIKIDIKPEGEDSFTLSDDLTL